MTNKIGIAERRQKPGSLVAHRPGGHTHTYAHIHRAESLVLIANCLWLLFQSLIVYCQAQMYCNHGKGAPLSQKGISLLSAATVG